MLDNGIIIVDIHKGQVKNAIDRAHYLGMSVYVIAEQQKIASNLDLINSADGLIECDYLNYNELLSTVLKVCEVCLVKMVFSLNENALLNVSKICDYLNLRGNSFEVISNIRDKYKQKLKLKGNGIEIADFALVEKTDDIKFFINNYGLPVVLKPKSLKGSVGVRKIRDLSEVEGAYTYCRQFVEVDETLIVERFIHGIEVSIEALSLGNEVHVWQVTDKILFDNCFVEKGHITPSVNYSNGKAKKITEKIIRALGVLYGPLHIEGFVVNNQFIVNEVHCRYGGDNISTLIEESQMVDIHTPYYCNTLQLDYKCEMTNIRSYVGINYLNMKPTLVGREEGIDKLKNLSDVLKYEYKPQSSKANYPLEKSRDRVGWFIIKGNTYQDVMLKMREVENELSIEGEINE